MVDLPPNPHLKEEPPVFKLDEEEILELKEKLKKPLDEQRELAAKLKLSLDKMMIGDLARNGYYGDHTLKILREYAALLNNIQHNLYGEKKTVDHNIIDHAKVLALMRANQPIQLSKDDYNVKPVEDDGFKITPVEDDCEVEPVGSNQPSKS